MEVSDGGAASAGQLGATGSSSSSSSSSPSPSPYVVVPRHLHCRLLFCNPVSFLVTANADGSSNVMTVSWLSPVDNHCLFTLSLNSGRHSLANVRARPWFGLCPAGAHQRAQLLQVGGVTGRDAPPSAGAAAAPAGSDPACHVPKLHALFSAAAAAGAGAGAQASDAGGAGDSSTGRRGSGGGAIPAHALPLAPAPPLLLVPPGQGVLPAYCYVGPQPQYAAGAQAEAEAEAAPGATASSHSTSDTAGAPHEQHRKKRPRQSGQGKAKHQPGPPWVRAVAGAPAHLVCRVLRPLLGPGSGSTSAGDTMTASGGPAQEEEEEEGDGDGDGGMELAGAGAGAGAGAPRSSSSSGAAASGSVVAAAGHRAEAGTGARGGDESRGHTVLLCEVVEAAALAGWWDGKSLAAPAGTPGLLSFLGSQRFAEVRPAE